VTQECGAAENAVAEKKLDQLETAASVALHSAGNGEAQSGVTRIAGKAFPEASKAAEITRKQPRILKDLQARKCLLAIVSQGGLLSSILGHLEFWPHESGERQKPVPTRVPK
jgi:hypothetical protein